jgi:hypothetical protein
MSILDPIRALGARAAAGLEDVGLSWLAKALNRKEVASNMLGEAVAQRVGQAVGEPEIVARLAAKGKPATVKAFMADKELLDELTGSILRNKAFREAVDETVAARQLFGGLGAGALTGASLYGGKRLIERGEPKRAEALGTPYTDGFFKFCLDRGLDGEQVAEMLEKGAQADGRLGDECKGLLDRL